MKDLNPNGRYQIKVNSETLNVQPKNLKFVERGNNTTTPSPENAKYIPSKNNNNNKLHETYVGDLRDGKKHGKGMLHTGSSNFSNLSRKMV
jgi:hypothetical protein